MNASLRVMVSATRDASCCLEYPEAEFVANDNDPKDSNATQRKIIPVPK